MLPPGAFASDAINNDISQQTMCGICHAPRALCQQETGRGHALGHCRRKNLDGDIHGKGQEGATLVVCVCRSAQISSASKAAHAYRANQGPCRSALRSLRLPIWNLRQGLVRRIRAVIFGRATGVALVRSKS